MCLLCLTAIYHGIWVLYSVTCMITSVDLDIEIMLSSSHQYVIYILTMWFLTDQRNPQTWWSPSLLQWLFQLLSSSLLLFLLLFTRRRKVRDSAELMLWYRLQSWMSLAFLNICFFLLFQKQILNNVSKVFFIVTLIFIDTKPVQD